MQIGRAVRIAVDGVHARRYPAANALDRRAEVGVAVAPLVVERRVRRDKDHRHAHARIQHREHRRRIAERVRAVSDHDAVKALVRARVEIGLDPVPDLEGHVLAEGVEPLAYRKLRGVDGRERRIGRAEVLFQQRLRPRDVQPPSVVGARKRTDRAARQYQQYLFHVSP